VPNEPGAPVRVGISLLSQDPAQFTGTRTYIRELTREFGRRPEQVSIEVLCNEHSASMLDGWAPPGTPITTASGYGVGSTRLSRVAGIGIGTVRGRSLARQFSDDVQLIHYPLTINVPPVRGPSVMTLHDIQHHELPEMFAPYQRLWRKLVYDRPALRSTKVITDSEFSRERIISLIGVDPERVVTVHLGVDTQRFNPAGGVDDERVLADLSLPDRFVIYPASLWRHKNHERLLEAVARVPDDTLHLLLTGASFGRVPSLMALAERFGIAARVRHIGFVSDDVLPALYRRAVALVFPSLYEGFGAPPLEAMASGCPVASSMATSLAEVCGDAALELVPGDVGQMAEAIAAVVSDGAVREALRARGFEQARRFSWSDAADAHVAVYREAVSSGA
jgi:glycosyltransferase involved in cell wall biosynthesis